MTCTRSVIVRDDRRPLEHGQAARASNCGRRGRRRSIRGDLYGVIPADVRAPYDVREVIERIVDGSELHEFKALLRHDAGLRLRAHLGHTRSPSSPTTACCSPRAR